MAHENPCSRTAGACEILALSNEDAVEIDRLTQTLHALHRPETASERLLVERIAAGQWRIRRCWNTAATLVRIEMSRQPDPLTYAPFQIRLAAALSAIDHAVLAGVAREERLHSRAAAQARRQLLWVQSMRAEHQAGANETGACAA